MTSKETRVEHTPTPWKIEDPGVGCNFLEIVGSDASVISEVGMWTPKAKQNAAFIVRAVNAHDDLVKVLKALIEKVEEENRRDGISFALEEEAERASATLSRIKTEG